MIIATNSGMNILIPIILILIPAYAFSSDGAAKSSPIVKAMEAVSAHRPAEAVNILSTYRPSAAELFSYHNTYAKALQDSKKVYDSIEHYSLAYIYAPPGEKKELALLERAEAYMFLKYYAEASLSFNIFLKTFPHFKDHERVQTGLAEAFYKQGFFKEALSHYELAGTTPRALLGKAQTLQALGKLSSAYDIYMVLNKSSRAYLFSFPEAVYNAGETLRLLGKYPDAKIYLNSAKEPALKGRVYLSLGLIELHEGKYSSAMNYFNLALGLTADKKIRRQALLNSADACMKLGKKEDAKRSLIEIKNNFPYSLEYDAAILMLARLYKGDGNTDAAIPLLKELVVRRSPEAKALNELEAIILETMEDKPEEFTKLWKVGGNWLLEPARSESLLKIARKLKPEGTPFLNLCKWLLRYGADNVKMQVRVELVDFYAGLGNLELASKYLQEVKIRGENDEITRIRARIYRLNAEALKAAETLMSVKEIEHSEVDMLSDMQREIKTSRRAVKFYEKAINKVGGSAAEYIKFADLLYEIGGKKDALKYYRTAVSMIKAEDLSLSKEKAWALYRIAALSDSKESLEALKALPKSDDALGRFTAARLKELELSEKLIKRNF